MKKRLLSLLLAFALVLSVLPAASVFAANAYDLWIDGVQVTDGNRHDILGGGEFAYDNVLKELYIYKDYESEEVIIDSHVDGLTIYTCGDDARRLVSTKNDVIQLNASTTILGSRLYLETKGPSDIAAAICYIGSTGVLTIKNSSVEAHGAWTINGYHEGSELHVDRSRLSVYATKKAVADFGNIRLTDCEIVQPLGGYVKFENSHMSIVNVDGTDADRVEIGEFFELWLDGTQVTRTNAYDPLGDGTFAFDPDTKTLTVKKDYSSYSTTVYNKINGLTVTSVGHHTLQSRANHVFINEEADMKFSYADLTINAASVGIYHKSETASYKLRIVYSKLEIFAQWGICGEMKHEVVKFEESDVDIHTDHAAVSDIGSKIELEGCHITPDDCAVGFGRNSIKQGADLAKDVHILPNVKEEYPLYIRGWQVTNLNCSNIGGDDIFSYDPKTNELLVKGDVTYAGRIIGGKIEGLTIEFTKPATLLCTDPDASAIELYDDATIEADNGTVAIRSASQANDAIYMGSGANLTIASANDLQISGNHAILGSGGKVFFRNSNVTCSSKSGAVMGFDSGVRFAACGVKEPAGYEIFDGEIRTNGGTEAAKKVVISTDAAPQAYELWVAGVQVNDSFCDDILGDGVFSYDPAYKVLTIAGDYEATTGDWLIKSGIEDLTIRVAADSELKVNGTLASVLDLRANTKITGPYALYCVAEAGGGVTVSEGAKLSIEDAELYTAGGVCGILCNTGSELFIDCSYVAAKGDIAALAVMGGITIYGVRLTHPAGGYNGPDGYFLNADGSFAKEVEFTPDEVETYPLSIDGVPVTEANRRNILHDGPNTFSYDPAVKTLCVNGSYTADLNLILSQIPGLRILFTNDLKLESRSGMVICTDQDLTLRGEHDVTLAAKKDACILMDTSEEVTLTVADLDLTCRGEYGIRGYGEKEKLIIDNARVQTLCTECGICSFGGGITLNKCYIKDPADAKIEGTSIVNADGDDLGTVLIERGDKPTTPEPPDPPKPPDGKNPFVDVKSSDYFYDAVLWAYNRGVTTGTDATHFGPNATCTRGQIVTFLWRALGEPAPTITKNPFVDVKESDYYYKAVLWAYENGVTTGTDATHFAPNAYCKREHAVAFLYRAAGKPAYTNKTNPFVDVSSDAYYYDAVLWAVEKNITKGMDEKHFGPSNSCQRCQIVTFLYRFMNP